MLDNFYVLPVLNLFALVCQEDFKILYWLIILCSFIIYSDFLIKECFRTFSRCMLTGVKTALISNEKFSFLKFFTLFLSLSVSSYCTNSTFQNIVVFIFTLLILVIYRYFYKLSTFEKKDLTARHNLSLGYGQALCYYENYLKKCLGNKLVIRIRNFESREGIRIPHKLYILVPLSCKLIDYIDDSDYIKRCKEVPPLEMDYSGIPSRLYNITVYSIRCLDSHIRCALEYAQPLKVLYALKSRNLLSENELHSERKIFCESLKEMLKDSKNSYEYCDLIEFNDELEELHEVLLRHIKTDFVQKN